MDRSRTVQLLSVTGEPEGAGWGGVGVGVRGIIVDSLTAGCYQSE